MELKFWCENNEVTLHRDFCQVYEINVSRKLFSWKKALVDAEVENKENRIYAFTRKSNWWTCVSVYMSEKRVNLQYAFYHESNKEKWNSYIPLTKCEYFYTRKS